MSRVTTRPLPGTQIDPRYPDSDGRPMGDTDYHSIARIALRQALLSFFAGRRVYIATNLLLYWKEGHPRCRRDPDVLVAKGVGTHCRRSLRVWEEGKVPQVLFEIASRDTFKADLERKPGLYASIGVKEYFVFDPEGPYLDPVLLRGFRTVSGKPVAMEPGPAGSLVSRQLGLKFVPEDTTLGVIDVKTGQSVLTPRERAEQLRERAEREWQCAERAIQRARQLLAQLRALGMAPEV